MIEAPLPGNEPSACIEAGERETIGRLAGGIAHDFNNLLMVILASLALLEKRLPDDARARTLLESARTGARRGSDLTQRLLAFARRQQLNPEPLVLEELLEKMNVRLVAALGTGISLERSLSSDAGRVFADADQLEIALLEIARNASDAMPCGGRLSIEAHAVPSSVDARLQSGEYVMISVSDTGSGMDEFTLTRATEPFFSTRGAGKGPGMGLSVVEGFVCQSGGLLRLRSALGTGTTVELLLPAAPMALRPPSDSR